MWNLVFAKDMKKWEKTHLEKKVQNDTDENITSHWTQITSLILVKVITKYIFASKKNIELGNFQVNIYIYIREPFIFTIISKNILQIYNLFASKYIQDLNFKSI